MLRISNLFKNSLSKKIEDDEMISKSNNLGQNLAESKKLKNHQNLAKSRKLSHYPKSSKPKKAILDKSEILVNLTVATNTTWYLTSKAKKTFI